MSNVFFQKLIKSCQEKISNYNLPELERAGFERNLTKYSFTAIYPPLKAMSPINPNDILSSTGSDKKNIHLYFHFPFCTGRCIFCHFNTNPFTENHHLINKYLDSLIKEFNIFIDKLRKVKIISIYIGGGSPSLMSPSMIGKIINHVKTKTEVINPVSTTIELQPELARQNYHTYLKNLKIAGINRISIGIQDFNEHVLRAANRRHTVKDSITLIKAVQEVGIFVDIDLLMPLPYQTPQNWYYTLKTAFNLNPYSISIFTTAIRKKIPIYKVYKDKRNLFPGRIDSYLMYLMAEEMARINNYYESPIGMFVRSRNLVPWQKHTIKINRLFNLLKTTTIPPKKPVELLGIGAAAYSFLNNYQYYNTPSLHQYIAKVNSHQLPIWRGYNLSKRELFIREIVLGLKEGSINKVSLKKRYSYDIEKVYKNYLKTLTNLGLIKFSWDQIMLTEKGYLFSDEIITNFTSEPVKRLIKNMIYKSKEEKDLVDIYNFFCEL